MAAAAAGAGLRGERVGQASHEINGAPNDGPDGGGLND